MYKAIKDNKIIAINEDGLFPLLICDEIKQDKKHKLDDYIEYNGELVLKNQNPEPLQQKMRIVRDSYINSVEWRIERYRNQKELEITTSDTEQEYKKILEYQQYLRDYPQSEGEWWNKEPLDYESWKNQNN